MTKTIYKSPLRYPGGKSAVVEEIAKKFPKKCNQYVEPFVGGGSVLMHARSMNFAKRYYISDSYGALMWFWMCVKDNPMYESMVCELYDLLEWKLEDKKAYFKQLQSKNLDSAADFFFSNRVSFSGTIESGGFSKQACEGRFTESSIARLRNAKEALQGVQIGIHSFEIAFNTFNDPNSFFFCDPPYFTAEKLYGRKGDLHKGFNHQLLAECVKRSKAKVLLTYDDCPEIRELYKGLIIEPWDVRYSMGNTKRGAELFIRNYLIDSDVKGNVIDVHRRNETLIHSDYEGLRHFLEGLKG